MSKDTILIFEKPDSYFFPHYKEITFSPFGVPTRSLRYLIYKLLYILHLPCCSFFWGDWKHHIKSARQVIIFDYGYQRGMETYIHRINPNCKVYLFLWNKIDRLHRNHRLFSDKSAIYSTDLGDCRSYQLNYNHMFYPMEYRMPYLPNYKNRLFFMGWDKGRGAYIAALEKCFSAYGLSCDIRLLTGVKDPGYRQSLSAILTDKPLSYDAYCKELNRCGILLDINQEGQSALTMRVMEAMFFSKKLITGNQDIITYDFYNENNIFVLPKQPAYPSAEAIKAFLEKPFVPYKEEILNQYSFEHWKSMFA